MDIEQIKQEAIRLAEVKGNRSAFVYELDDEVYPFTHYTELYAITSDNLSYLALARLKSNDHRFSLSNFHYCRQP